MSGKKQKRLPIAVLVLSLLVAALSPKVTVLAWDGSMIEADPSQGQTLLFKDAWGLTHRCYVDSTALPVQYNLSLLQRNGNDASYTQDSRYVAAKGIDVSSFSGSIDWAQVRAQGYSFAFIRLGYDGLSTGVPHIDLKFVENLQGAQAAGLAVGVYFYSCAVNEAEAFQEAQYCVAALQGAGLQLPIVYDAELSRGRAGRNDGIGIAQCTYNATVFCEYVKAFGYKAGVYANMIFEGFLYQMPIIQNYSIWYADYETVPQSPYQYEFLQYQQNVRIAGAEGYVDLDLWFLPTQPRTEPDGTVFDPIWYACAYPDVWAALGWDHDALYNHYVTVGQYEGRKPSSQQQ